MRQGEVSTIERADVFTRNFTDLSISIKNSTMNIKKSDSKVLMNNEYQPVTIHSSTDPINGMNDTAITNLARRAKFFMKKYFPGWYHSFKTKELLTNMT